MIFSYAYWQNHFAGSSDISGHTLVLDGAVYTFVLVVANYVQARRAMRVDPMVALRHE